jgi:hypothetical protein
MSCGFSPGVRGVVHNPSLTGTFFFSVFIHGLLVKNPFLASKFISEISGYTKACIPKTSLPIMSWL